MTDQEQHHTIKKMEVVFEEVFENANNLPPDSECQGGEISYSVVSKDFL